MSAPLPPHDVEAELAIVAALAYYGPEMAGLSESVAAEDFYHPMHGDVWAECLAILARGDRPSHATLRAAMPQLDNQTLATYTITAHAPTQAGARRLAVLVAELASRRRLLAAAHELDRGARELSTDLQAVVDDAKAGISEAGSPVAAIPPGPDLMEFFEQVDEDPPWVVPGMIGRGDRVLLVAEEGAGKSTTLRQVCLQVTAGLHPFSESREIPPLPAMLVDAENPPHEVRRALRSMYLAAGARLNPALMTVHTKPEGVDLLNRADRRWLTERLAANRPALLAMGPLYKLHNQDPIDERPARQVAAVLDDLRVRYDFALLLEAHAPHATGGRLRVIRPYGASLWMRWPDLGPTLVKEGGENGEPASWHFGQWRPPRGIRNWPRAVTSGGRWPWLAPSLYSVPAEQVELLPGSSAPEGMRHAR